MGASYCIKTKLDLDTIASDSENPLPVRQRHYIKELELPHIPGNTEFRRHNSIRRNHGNCTVFRIRHVETSGHNSRLAEPDGSSPSRR